MLKKLLFWLFFLNVLVANAEMAKTDVLIIGGGVSGVSAAIQSAHSKLKTMLIIPGPWLNGSFNGTEIIVLKANRNLPSGIWGEFQERIQAYYKNKAGYDTSRTAPLRFERSVGAAILKQMADSAQNLTVYTDASYTTIRKDGSGWVVTISIDGKTETIIAKVLVDATENGDVIGKLGIKFNPAIQANNNDEDLKLYRTSIATGDEATDMNLSGNRNDKYNYLPAPDYYIPLSAAVVKDADNLLVTEKAIPGNKNIQYLPLQLNLGQGVGCIAAYCAFFKTTTKNLKIRIIQGELLDFKGYLLPITDMSQTDRAWRSIQQVCATGLLKGFSKQESGSVALHFLPDTVVNTVEIQPVLCEIYTRAFIWFNKEKPAENFTVSNLLSLISELTLTDPQILQTEMQKTWKTQYQFKSDFDLQRQVTRREFAVLVNKFLNPFARTVDLDGRLVN